MDLQQIEMLYFPIFSDNILLITSKSVVGE
jgi:hypothetical protein